MNIMKHSLIESKQLLTGGETRTALRSRCWPILKTDNRCKPRQDTAVQGYSTQGHFSLKPQQKERGDHQFCFYFCLQTVMLASSNDNDILKDINNRIQVVCIVWFHQQLFIIHYSTTTYGSQQQLYILAKTITASVSQKIFKVIVRLKQ